MSIGSLAVRVSANTSNYNKNMRATRGPAQDMRKRINRVAKSAGKMSAALAATGAAITAHLVNKGLDAIDTQAKLARQLGTTQATVAGLTRAAKDAGIESGQLESNIQALNKRLGEAQEGSGRAADTLDKLGLSAQSLAEMPLDERMDTIGAAINSLDTQTEKAAATADLFSRSGLNMMNVFEQGEGSIKKAAEEARDFGVAVTRVDSAQVEAANDAMSRIGDVIQGVSNQLAVEFAPYIEAASSRITDISQETQGFTHHITAAVNMGVAGFGKLADVMRGLHVVGKGITLAFQAIGTAVFSVTTMIQEGWERIIGKIASSMQWLTRQANRLPGVNIPTEGLENFERGMEAAANANRNLRHEMQQSVAQTAEELHNLATQPMPSEGIDEFLADVREKSRQAAEEMSANRSSAGGGGSVSGDGDQEGNRGKNGGGEAEQKRKDMMKRIEYLTEGLATEREIKQENFEKEMERMREQREMLLMTEEEFRQRSRNLEVQHWNKMAGLRENSMNALASITGDAWGKEAAMVTSAMQDMLTSTAQHSKSAFEMQKKVAIANAVINGYESATAAWKAGMSVGGPAGPAIAAAYMGASLAATGAKISAIKSQSFKGGSGGSTGAGGAGGVPTTGGGAVPGTGGGAEQQSRVVNPTFNIEGDSISKRQFRGMIDGLNETLDDGAELGTVRVN